MVGQTISVFYQNEEIAVLGYDRSKLYGYFEYTPSFIDKNIDLAPIKMPVVARKVYSFPDLNAETFKGLPGMVADSLPDKFGTSVLNQWIARQGRTVPLTPLERLQYTGKRGIGALEYRPSTQFQKLNASQPVDLTQLSELAQSVVSQRQQIALSMPVEQADPQAMRSLLAVGTSAGGARAKAVLAFNSDFTQVRSGQVDAPGGFTHYLMKFDGVVEGSQQAETFGDPLGYGVMEYVYYLIAKRSGIDMAYSVLINEGVCRHFVTRRFDRLGNQKIHTQTLSAIAHVDYHSPGSFSYEELFAVARQLRLPVEDARQLFMRMAFNLIARNNDDHAKNFSFILNENQWRLSPAYDMAYCYKPNNAWVEQHWMPANGKRIQHTRKDLIAVGQNMTRLPLSDLNDMVDKVVDSISLWTELSREYEVPEPLRSEIEKHLPLADFS